MKVDNDPGRMDGRRIPPIFMQCFEVGSAPLDWTYKSARRTALYSNVKVTPSCPEASLRPSQNS